MAQDATGTRHGPRETWNVDLPFVLACPIPCRAEARALTVCIPLCQAQTANVVWAVEP